MVVVVVVVVLLLLCSVCLAVAFPLRIPVLLNVSLVPPSLFSSLLSHVPSFVNHPLLRTHAHTRACSCCFLVLHIAFSLRLEKRCTICVSGTLCSMLWSPGSTWCSTCTTTFESSWTRYCTRTIILPLFLRVCTCVCTCVCVSLSIHGCWLSCLLSPSNALPSCCRLWFAPSV